MSSPPRVAGRPISLAGLRVILMTMSGFLVVFIAIAMFAHGSIGSDDTSQGDALLPVVALLAVMESLAIFFLRRRLRKAWTAELEEKPYEPGGDLPTSYAQAVLIGAALAEGVGLFAGVVHLLSGNPYAIGLAGLAFFAILAQLPREEAFLTSKGKP